jgi:hypothetical protein
MAAKGSGGAPLKVILGLVLSLLSPLPVHHEMKKFLYTCPRTWAE